MEKERQILLDLTNRNRLLSYKRTKARGVGILAEDIQSLFDTLVVEKKSACFLPSDTKEEEEEEEEKTEEEDYPPPPTTFRLQTDHEVADLNKRIKNTGSVAKTSIEEEGVNILFLAIGMLSWNDGKREGSQKSPLVLIPVSLSRASIQAGYVMSYNEEEVSYNISLQAKLKNDFGIEWPSFDEESPEDGLDIKAYMEKCRHAIQGKGGWSVESNAVELGFFSFSNFVLFKDLDLTFWPESIFENPILKALFGGQGFRNESPLIGSDEGSLDSREEITDLVQVVDADSSQSVVMAEVAAGRSMIVQGPPGTGKSQTITNLIADAVAKGKSVLFVAEKMAALNVVKARLDNVGIGAIALELHSKKTRKSEFLENLQEVWNEAGLVEPPDESHVFKDAVEFLNRHADEVNMNIGNSKVSAFDIFGSWYPMEKALPEERPELTFDEWTLWSQDDFDKKRYALKDLEASRAEAGSLAEHPFRHSNITSVLPDDLDRISRLSAIAAATGRQLEQYLVHVRDLLEIDRDLTPDVAKRLMAVADLLGTEVVNLAGVQFDKSSWQSMNEDFIWIVEQVGIVKTAKDQYGEALSQPAWSNKDVSALVEVLVEYQAKWTRVFSSMYQAARKKAGMLWKIKAPFSRKLRLHALQSVLRAQKAEEALEDNRESLERLFGTQWRGSDSDQSLLEAVHAHVVQIHANQLPEDLENAMFQALANGSRFTKLIEMKRELLDLIEKWESASDNASKQVEADHSCLGGEIFSTLPLPELIQLFEIWKETPERIREIGRFNAAMQSCKDSGLELEVLQKACGWCHAGEFLVKLFDFQWRRSLLETHLQQASQLKMFDGRKADELVDAFRKGDEKSFIKGRFKVMSSHSKTLPPLTGAGEMGILRHEFAKKKRHKSIRRLVHDAGNAIRKAKPVFMMSPYSVATYLSKDIRFDMVIFDEASQLRPVDAIGAVLRADQTIVVGDPKQLPPTSFFSRGIENDDEDEDEQSAADVESILGLFESCGSKSLMLRWHYRSRHSSLIEYSNHAFYQDRLTLFPSPLLNRDEMGLKHILVDDGYYEAGTTKRHNVGEAQYIAKKVMEHAATRPKKSLGVVAFSSAQQAKISDELEILRRKSPDLEDFFNENRNEPFFVKNLENVQGDERDLIFISVGYGKGADGILKFNFGPLNRVGGQRRLNVLITRAKERCVVFSNFTHTDMDLSRTKSDGVRHLCSFLQLAVTGQMSVAEPTDREPDSPFELEVLGEIREMGYDVHSQVGSKGYFIDLAIIHPNHPGSYLLAVECDGASYHSARWARDRDRLRQSVLEGLGWDFHRIWSTCWFQDRGKEIEKLRGRIEELMKSKPDSQKPSTSPVIPLPQKNPIQARTMRRVEASKNDHPKASQHYVVTNLDMSPVANFDDVSDEVFLHRIKAVIETEAPVHEDIVAKRVIHSLGKNRLGNQIKARFQGFFTEVSNEISITRQGSFFYIGAVPVDHCRDRSEAPDAPQEITHIAPEELEKAIFITTEHAVSILYEELYKEVISLFGFKKLTEKRKKPLVKLVDGMVAMGRLKEQNGKIHLP